MTFEDEVRDAVAATAGEPGPPSPELIDRVLDRAARRRRSRLVGAAGVVLLVATGSLAAVAAVDRDGKGTTSVATRPPADPTTTLTTDRPPPEGDRSTLAVAATTTRVVVVDMDERRVVRTLAEVREGGVIGVSLSADGSVAYWGAFRPVSKEPCFRELELFSAPVNGSAAPTRVANGVGPRVSPDGRHLAYLDNVNRRGIAGAWQHSPSCANALVIRDLATGDEVVWVPGSEDTEPYSIGGIDDLVWSPDSTRIALGFGWEDSYVYLLDQPFAGGRLADVRRIETREFDDSAPLDWDAVTRDLVLRRHCCYGADEATSHGDVVLFEPDSGAVSTSTWFDGTEVAADLDQTGERLATIRRDAAGRSRLFVQQREAEAMHVADDIVAVDVDW